MKTLEILRDTPPWEWPEDAADTFHELLTNKAATKSERLIAAELAGDSTVINDELAEVLMKVVADPVEPEELRARAVISLGPALEMADTHGFDDPDDLDDVPISEEMFHHIQETLRNLYPGETVAGKQVRRRILEASVRAPEDWHREAIQKAWSSGDQEWMLTAAFCMRWISGFDDSILQALKNKDEEIRTEAVEAAGNWKLEGAWPEIVAILNTPRQPKHMLITAIEAAASIHPKEARDVLEEFTTSRDEEIAEAAEEAIMMADAEAESGGEEFDDAEENEDGWVN